jgi:hypothetical protein
MRLPCVARAYNAVAPRKDEHVINGGRRFGVALGFIEFFLLASAQIGFAQTAAPTLQDAQKKLDAGQYQDALRIISPLLASAGDDNNVRYQLLMLRGEALLQLQQRLPAANAFDVAVKFAPDAKAKAAARANALLLRASPDNKYVPKAGGEPIDILNPVSRKAAFVALRKDLLAAVTPKYTAALNSNSLVPMMNVLPSILDLAYLEFAADGSAPQTHNDLKAMGARARELMNGELRRIRYQLDALEAASNSTTDYGRRGLTSDERAMVQNNIEYVTKIGQTARDARRRAQALGYEGAAWEPVIADCDDLVDRAQAMLSVSN